MNEQMTVGRVRNMLAKANENVRDTAHELVRSALQQVDGGQVPGLKIYDPSSRFEVGPAEAYVLAIDGYAMVGDAVGLICPIMDIAAAKCLGEALPAGVLSWEDEIRFILTVSDDLEAVMADLVIAALAKLPSGCPGVVVCDGQAPAPYSKEPGQERLVSSTGQALYAPTELLDLVEKIARAMQAQGGARLPTGALTFKQRAVGALRQYAAQEAARAEGRRRQREREMIAHSEVEERAYGDRPQPRGQRPAGYLARKARRSADDRALRGSMKGAGGQKSVGVQGRQGAKKERNAKGPKKVAAH